MYKIYIFKEYKLKKCVEINKTKLRLLYRLHVIILTDP